MEITYQVICREDSAENTETGELVRGDYTLATRKVFFTLEPAQEYDSGISSSRDPIIFSRYNA
jgi:hypothetical protein